MKLLFSAAAAATLLVAHEVQVVLGFSLGGRSSSIGGIPKRSDSSNGRREGANNRNTVSSSSRFRPRKGRQCMSMSTGASSEHDILLRVAKGEQAERTPVWLMRQAGRYMADFRKFSDKYPFRHRSETPEIAVELSLQCWKKFGMDGVIMFSDILTPLPAMGIDFDVVKGKGPVIPSPIRTAKDISDVRIMDAGSIDDMLPFVGKTLQELRKETDGKSTLLGFVGSPWTLAAYAIEGGSSKHALYTKELMMYQPDVFKELMDKLALSIGEYACYQIRMGAQVIQFFESWAHQMTPMQFERFAKPYANKAMAYVKARYPDTPVIFFANGGSSYLHLQTDMAADMISLDQYVDMAEARHQLGAHIPVSGNLDPLVLMGPEEGIREAVRECVVKGGGQGHILNLGHGVIQQTPEEAVGILVDACKELRLDGLRGEMASLQEAGVQVDGK